MIETTPLSEACQDALTREQQQLRFKRALAYGVAGIMLATSGAIAVRDRQLIRERKAIDAANRLAVIPSRNRLTYTHST